jgi:hypothetical protein
MTLGPALFGMLLPLMQPSPCLIADPGGPAQAVYLIVAADAFANDCDALLAHRAAGGLSVGLVRFSDVCRVWGGRSGPDALVACLSHARTDWGTRFVLLVGDAAGPPERAIPFRVEPAAYVSDRFVTSRELAHDWDYATLGGPEPVLHVGRFPVRTSEELAVMIGKTIAYETRVPAGEWQARLRFVAGPYGDPTIDRALETQFAQLVSEGIPPSYDVEIAYANPASPYCPFPPSFHQNAMRMLNEGSLLYCYIGHGSERGLDELTWKKQTYPFLEASQVGEVTVSAGLPVMVVIACCTAALDTPGGDCLGAALMKRPAGPVALIGSTRICQPYGNALLGRYLAGTVFSPQYPTLGEAFTEALRRTLAPDTSESRRQVDFLAAVLQGGQALPQIRHDTVRHYLLLGDPALVLRRPLPLTGLTATLEGDGVRIQCPVPSGRGALHSWQVCVSLRGPSDRSARPLPPAPAPDAPDFPATMMARYRAANDRTFAAQTLTLDRGALNVKLPLPADWPSGAVFARAVVWNDKTAAANTVRLVCPAPPH